MDELSITIDMLIERRTRTLTRTRTADLEVDAVDLAEERAATRDRECGEGRRPRRLGLAAREDEWIRRR